MRRNHAHGEAGFSARTRSAPTGTAADDAYLQILDRCLIAGVLTDDGIATLRSTVQAWNLSPARLEALHHTYIDTLQPATRAAVGRVLRARLQLVAQLPRD